MKLDIWSIVIIVIAVQGLFLLFVLNFSKANRKRRGNNYLALVVLTLLWFLVEFFTVRNKIDVGLGLFYGTRYGSWFLLGPLTYFYFNAVTDNSWKLKAKDLVHLVPFVVFVIIVPFISYRTLADRQIDYGMLSVFDHREKVLTTIQWMYSIVFVAQFAYVGMYLLGNLNLLKRYTRLFKEEYAIDSSHLKWLRSFLISLLIILVAVAGFLYLLLITDIYRRHLDYIYVLPVGLLFYLISFKLMKADCKPVSPAVKYASTGLDAATVPALREQLNELMESEQLFLNPSIRLKELATSMDLKPHHLSQLINQEYGCSFNDFINKHRIATAKQLLSQHPEFTIMKVALESGFNNKTSFVNSFKKFAGQTPSAFRESQRTS